MSYMGYTPKENITMLETMTRDLTNKTPYLSRDDRRLKNTFLRYKTKGDTNTPEYRDAALPSDTDLPMKDLQDADIFMPIIDDAFLQSKEEMAYFWSAVKLGVKTIPIIHQDIWIPFPVLKALRILSIFRYNDNFSFKSQLHKAKRLAYAI